MKKMNQFLMLLLFALSINSCGLDDDDGWGRSCLDGDGSLVTRDLNLPDFTGIKLHLSADVFIQQGPDQEVWVESYSNLIDELELDVQDGVWHIETDRCIDGDDRFDIYITLPEIDYVALSGSGRIKGDDTLIGDLLIMRVSGSGDIDLDLVMEDVDCKISGSGEIYLEGVCEDLDFDVSGSGELSAFALQTEKADVKISGSGDAELYVSDVLDVRISGSGDMRYKGNPVLNVNISGSGEVIDAN